MAKAEAPTGNAPRDRSLPADEGDAASEAATSRGDDELYDLEQVIDRIEEGAADLEIVSIRTMADAVGRRSFGPLLLFAGLLPTSPLSGIPTVPTMSAVIVVVIAGQLLFKRKHFWLPTWVLNRSISRSKLDKALKVIRPVARFVDRLLRPRLEFLTRHVAVYIIAALCVLIAATMPPLELVPFASTTAGAAIVAFGLALIANDGALALIALIFTVGTMMLIIRYMPGF